MSTCQYLVKIGGEQAILAIDKEIKQDIMPLSSLGKKSS